MEIGFEQVDGQNNQFIFELLVYESSIPKCMEVPILILIFQ
jgi:hypothetical protein